MACRMEPETPIRSNCINWLDWTLQSGTKQMTVLILDLKTNCQTHFEKLKLQQLRKTSRWLFKFRQLPDKNDLLHLIFVLRNCCKYWTQARTCCFRSTSTWTRRWLTSIRFFGRHSAVELNSTATTAKTSTLKVTSERLRIYIVNRRRSAKKGSVFPKWWTPHLLQREEDWRTSDSC